MVNLLKKMKPKEWAMFGLCMILVVAQVWIDLKLPDFMSDITLLLQTPGSELKDILIAGGYMLLCAVTSGIISVGIGYFASIVSSAFGKRVRSDIYNHIGKLSKEEMNNFSTASLLTRSVNDVTQVQSFVSASMQILIKAPILAVWAIIKILGRSYELSIVTAIAVVFLLAVIITLVVLCIPRFKIIQKQTDEVNKVTRENLTGERVIKAFNAEKYQLDKFEVVNNNLTNTNRFTIKTMSILGPTMNLVMSTLSLAIYWVGAYLINAAQTGARLTIFSDMVVFGAYAAQIIMAFMFMVVIFMVLPRATISAKRINEVLKTNPSITGGNVSCGNNSGEIVFNNVSFKYKGADAYVLKNINLTINKGERVAFIGSTGSGKSTLINLLPRFFDATEGTVSIDGVNVKDYKLNELYNKFGYISQQATLFSGTIKENIAFGLQGESEIDMERIEKASKIAEASEFINKTDDKYNLDVNQGGKNLSGGQKQRISIARALYKNPAILIFDDSFSALDFKTDKRVRKNLDKQLSDVTCLIVAQRVGTIMNADKIVVMNNGEIVGVGKHDDLINTCEEYKKIVISQLSKEEI